MATAENGQFVWHDFFAKDRKAAIAFYSELLAWKTQPFTEGGGDYLMWVGSQGPLGGVMSLPDDMAKMGAPPHWTAHVQVADVDAGIALVRELGGKVFAEPTDVPTVGRFAVIGDPQGAVLSLFRPKQPMELHDAAKDGEFCWSELVTTDAAAAFTFYSRLLGWRTLEEMDMGPMGTYRIFGVGETRIGGIMAAPKGAPTAWLYYLSTRDLDAAIARAAAKGAKVLNGPMDIPGGARIAQLLDPQGAAFALHQAPKE